MDPIFGLVIAGVALALLVYYLTLSSKAKEKRKLERQRKLEYLAEKQKLFEEKQVTVVARNQFLESKTWYRLYKVLGVTIIILSFFAPMFVEDASAALVIIAGIVNMFVWYFVYLIVKKALVYIIYGKRLDELVKNASSEDKK